MACTINSQDTAFLVNMRLLAAFAASLSLHLIAFALLVFFVPATDFVAGGASAWPKAQFIVAIATPEKSGLHTASPPAQFPQNANEATGQNTRKGSVPPSSLVLQRERYFSVSELDVIPKSQRDIDLYPTELRNFKHGSGKIVLRLWIDETGRVTKVEPVSSGLPDIFAEVAARTFMQADFLPGRKNGLAVKSKVEAVLSYPSQNF